MLRLPSDSELNAYPCGEYLYPHGEDYSLVVTALSVPCTLQGAQGVKEIISSTPVPVPVATVASDSLEG